VIAPSPAIGTLRERVQLLRKTETTEAEGGHTVAFTPLATVWARVHTLSGRLTDRADARAASTTHSVVIRFRSDLSAGDRITWRGRTFEITGTSDINGRRAYLSCSCNEAEVAG